MQTYKEISTIKGLIKKDKVAKGNLKEQFVPPAASLYQVLRNQELTLVTPNCLGYIKAHVL